jgi:ABC-type uncharacterized transport system involved in gliding motility auxiliary subunit
MGKGQIRVVAVVGLLLLGTAVLIASVQGTGFSTPTKIMALLGAGLLVVAAVLGIGAIVALLRTRQGRFGMNVLTGSLIAVGIAILVNLLGTRYSARADVTAASRFTLAEQTQKVLAQLRSPLTIHTAVPANNPAAILYVSDLVKEYDESSDRVHLRVIDPARDPGLVEKLGIRGQTWVVLESDDRLERLGAADMSEEGLTNAIVRVTREEKRRVYVVTGHGERSIDDESPSGYSRLRDALRQENYELVSLNLVDAGDVPQDAAVVLVLSPQSPLFVRDAEILAHYLDRGGHVLFAIDLIVSQGRLVDLGLDPLLAAYGIELGKGLIYDDTPFAKQRGVGHYVPLAGSLSGKHAITTGFTNAISVFPQSRGVWHQGGRGQATVLAATVAQTWEETDYLDPETKPRFDADRDLQGPIPVAYAIEAPALVAPTMDILADRERKLTPPMTRLVVVGDADFAANASIAISQLANRDLVLSSIAWLAEQEDLVAVRPKNPDERRLDVNAAKRNVIRITSTVLFPMAIVVAGVLVWIRRRTKDV